MKTINPDTLARARGFSHGALAPPGARTLFVAGQVGWDQHGAFASDELASQFARALDNVLEVVAAAGGGPTAIGQMTVYVLDLDEYRAARRELGRIWRERFGDHCPAMALVCVRGLLEPRARVEIQATAAV